MMTPTMRPQPRFNNMGSGGSAMMQQIRQRRQQAMAQQAQTPQMPPQGPAPAQMGQAPAQVAPPNGGGLQMAPGGPSPQVAPQQSQAIQSTNPQVGNPYAAAAQQVKAPAQSPTTQTPLRGQPGGPPAYSAANPGPGQTAAMYAPGGIFDPAMTANMPPGQGTAILAKQQPGAGAAYGAQVPVQGPTATPSGGAPTGGPMPVMKGQPVQGPPAPTAQPQNAPPPRVGSGLGTPGVAPVTPPSQPAPASHTPPTVGGGMGMPQRQAPMAMARGGFTSHIRHAHPMHPHMGIPRRGLPMEQPSEDTLPREPTDGGAEGPPAPPGIHIPQYAHGGFPRAPAVGMHAMHGQDPLQNPMPMARQMARYRSQGGPAANIEKPMTSPKYMVNSGKNSQRRFPMPKSEMDSMTSSAYQ